MSIGSHELALTIINTGEGYERRMAIARSCRKKHTALNVHAAARDWSSIVREGARHYEMQFGSKGASCFTVEDLLECASELAGYYDDRAIEEEHFQRCKSA